MKEYKSLAAAIFRQATEDREAAIRTLRTPYAALLRKRLTQAVQSDARTARRHNKEPRPKEVLEARARKSVHLEIEQARLTVRETTEFLTSQTHWHEVLDIQADAVARRLEKGPITFDRSA